MGQPFFAAAFLSIAVAGMDNDAVAQAVDWQSKELDQVGIDEQLGAQLPLDMELRTPQGTKVSLGEFFDGERPVVLTLNYANCPQLCNLQLSGFVETLNKMDSWTVGKQFQVVTLSLDPNETDDLSQRFQQRVLSGYRNPDVAQSGWAFLRGTREQIHQVADTVGFHYNSFEDKGQFAHTAALILLDPQGKVARYLYGIEYQPSTLRLSLAETASSKYVSTVDALILRCFLYDAAAGTFVADAWKITRMVMSAVAVILFAFLGWLFLLERRVRKKTVA